jgi:hypothetical protein
MDQNASAILGLFPDPGQIDGVFYKLLTANDDSGRHGVLVPVESYSFFPSLPAVGEAPTPNPSEPIETVWSSNGALTLVASRFVQYDRYPERRMTALSPAAVNVDQAIRLLVVGHYQGTWRYACTVLTPPQSSRFEAVVTELGIPRASIVPGGAVGTVDAGTLRGADDAAFRDLLGRLQLIGARGPVASLRTGDTGVGFTLETLLGIPANVTRGGGDYRGIEIKASRSTLPLEQRPRPAGNVTLLAKTPTWGALVDRAGLLNTHGYVDQNGRFALYMSVYAGRPNPQGWALVDEPAARRIAAARLGVGQVWWTYEVLERRILEKHRESAFVTAYAQRRAEGETFLYDHVLHCRGATLANFLELVNERGVFVDFAMHRNELGGVRDHGFLFRTTQAQVPRLFRTVESFRLA